MSLMTIVAADTAVPFADLGQPVTYTPDASVDIDPFTVTGVHGRVTKDDGFGQGMRDESVLLVLHADFEAAGMTEPIPRSGGKGGDTATIKNLDGTDEIWIVNHAEPKEAGYWHLTIERVRKFNPQ